MKSVIRRCHLFHYRISHWSKPISCFASLKHYAILVWLTTTNCLKQNLVLRRRNSGQNSSGTKNIEDIRVGDLVLSKSDKTGEVGFKRVKRLFRNHTKRLTKVTYKLASSQIARAKGRTQRSRSGIKSKSSSNSDDSDGSEPAISSVIETPGHDWFSLDRGWIDACELKVGERLVAGSGETLEVVSVETWAESAPVYNFEVEDLLIVLLNLRAGSCLGS